MENEKLLARFGQINESHELKADSNDCSKKL